MRFALLASALLAAAWTQPVSAQSSSTADAESAPGGRQVSDGRAYDGGNGFDRRRRIDQTVVLPLGIYDSRFASRSWEPDSYNDWWHERPERSYPRWMQNNQNCERRWWGGGGWRC